MGTCCQKQTYSVESWFEPQLSGTRIKRQSRTNDDFMEGSQVRLSAQQCEILRQTWAQTLSTVDQRVHIGIMIIVRFLDKCPHLARDFHKNQDGKKGSRRERFTFDTIQKDGVAVALANSMVTLLTNSINGYPNLATIRLNMNRLGFEMGNRGMFAKDASALVNSLLQVISAQLGQQQEFSANSLGAWQAAVMVMIPLIQEGVKRGIISQNERAVDVPGIVITDSDGQGDNPDSKDFSSIQLLEIESASSVDLSVHDDGPNSRPEAYTTTSTFKTTKATTLSTEAKNNLGFNELSSAEFNCTSQNVTSNVDHGETTTASEDFSLDDFIPDMSNHFNSKMETLFPKDELMLVSNSSSTASVSGIHAVDMSSLENTTGMSVGSSTPNMVNKKGEASREFFLSTHDSSEVRSIQANVGDEEEYGPSNAVSIDSTSEKMGDVKGDHASQQRVSVRTEKFTTLVKETGSSNGVPQDSFMSGSLTSEWMREANAKDSFMGQSDEEPKYSSHSQVIIRTETETRDQMIASVTGINETDCSAFDAVITAEPESKGSANIRTAKVQLDRSSSSSSSGSVDEKRSKEIAEGTGVSCSVSGVTVITRQKTDGSTNVSNDDDISLLRRSSSRLSSSSDNDEEGKTSDHRSSSHCSSNSETLTSGQIVSDLTDANEISSAAEMRSSKKIRKHTKHNSSRRSSSQSNDSSSSTSDGREKTDAIECQPSDRDELNTKQWAENVTQYTSENMNFKRKSSSCSSSRSGDEEKKCAVTMQTRDIETTSHVPTSDVTIEIQSQQVRKRYAIFSTSNAQVINNNKTKRGSTTYVSNSDVSLNGNIKAVTNKRSISNTDSSSDDEDGNVESSICESTPAGVTSADVAQKLRENYTDVSGSFTNEEHSSGVSVFADSVKEANVKRSDSSSSSNDENNGKHVPKDADVAKGEFHEESITFEEAKASTRQITRRNVPTVQITSFHEPDCIGRSDHVQDVNEVSFSMSLNKTDDFADSTPVITFNTDAQLPQYSRERENWIVETTASHTKRLHAGSSGEGKAVVHVPLSPLPSTRRIVRVSNKTQDSDQSEEKSSSDSSDGMASNEDDPDVQVLRALKKLTSAKRKIVDAGGDVHDTSTSSSRVYRSIKTGNDETGESYSCASLINLDNEFHLSSGDIVDTEEIASEQYSNKVTGVVAAKRLSTGMRPQLNILTKNTDVASRGSNVVSTSSSLEDEPQLLLPRGSTIATKRLTKTSDDKSSVQNRSTKSTDGDGTMITVQSEHACGESNSESNDASEKYEASTTKNEQKQHLGDLKIPVLFGNSNRNGATANDSQNGSLDDNGNHMAHVVRDNMDDRQNSETHSSDSSDGETGNDVMSGKLASYEISNVSSERKLKHTVGISTSRNDQCFERAGNNDDIAAESTFSNASLVSLDDEFHATGEDIVEAEELVADEYSSDAGIVATKRLSTSVKPILNILKENAEGHNICKQNENENTDEEVVQGIHNLVKVYATEIETEEIPGDAKIPILTGVFPNTEEVEENEQTIKSSGNDETFSSKANDENGFMRGPSFQTIHFSSGNNADEDELDSLRADVKNGHVSDQARQARAMPFVSSRIDDDDVTLSRIVDNGEPISGYTKETINFVSSDAYGIDGDASGYNKQARYRLASDNEGKHEVQAIDVNDKSRSVTGHANNTMQFAISGTEEFSVPREGEDNGHIGHTKTVTHFVTSRDEAEKVIRELKEERALVGGNIEQTIHSVTSGDEDEYAIRKVKENKLVGGQGHQEDDYVTQKVEEAKGLDTGYTNEAKLLTCGHEDKDVMQQANEENGLIRGHIKVHVQTPGHEDEHVVLKGIGENGLVSGHTGQVMQSVFPGGEDGYVVQKVEEENSSVSGYILHETHRLNSGDEDDGVSANVEDENGLFGGIIEQKHSMKFDRRYAYVNNNGGLAGGPVEETMHFETSGNEDEMQKIGDEHGLAGGRTKLTLHSGISDNKDECVVPRTAIENRRSGGLSDQTMHFDDKGDVGQAIDQFHGTVHFVETNDNGDSEYITQNLEKENIQQTRGEKNVKITSNFQVTTHFVVSGDNNDEHTSQRILLREVNRGDDQNAVGHLQEQMHKADSPHGYGGDASIINGRDERLIFNSQQTGSFNRSGHDALGTGRGKEHITRDFQETKTFVGSGYGDEDAEQNVRRENKTVTSHFQEIIRDKNTGQVANEKSHSQETIQFVGTGDNGEYAVEKDVGEHSHKTLRIMGSDNGTHVVGDCHGISIKSGKSELPNTVETRVFVSKIERKVSRSSDVVASSKSSDEEFPDIVISRGNKAIHGRKGSHKSILEFVQGEGYGETGKCRISMADQDSGSLHNTTGNVNSVLTSFNSSNTDAKDVHSENNTFEPSAHDIVINEISTISGSDQLPPAATKTRMSSSTMNSSDFVIPKIEEGRFHRLQLATRDGRTEWSESDLVTTQPLRCDSDFSNIAPAFVNTGGHDSSAVVYAGENDEDTHRVVTTIVETIRDESGHTIERVKEIVTVDGVTVQTTEKEEEL